MEDINDLWFKYNEYSNKLAIAFGRTDNIVGEYAKYLTWRYYRGRFLKISVSSADIETEDGKRYQVTSQKIVDSTTTQLNVIRSWDFDYLVVVLFEQSGAVQKALEVPVEVAKEYCITNSYQNGCVISTTQKFLSDDRSTDISIPLKLIYMNNRNTNITEFYKEASKKLVKYTFFESIINKIPSSRGKVKFTNKWVILHFVLAPYLLLISSYMSSYVDIPLTKLITLIFVVYGFYRVYEFFIYQVSILLDSKIDNTVESYSRLITFLIHNYIELIFWFALFYFYFSDNFTKPDVVHTVSGALYYSAVTMATLGYGDIYPEKEFGRWIVIIHLLVSLFITIIIAARSISFLPRPQSKNKDEMPNSTDPQSSQTIGGNHSTGSNSR